MVATGVQLMMPIFALRMLDLFPEVRGSAASVQSCVMLGIGALFLGRLVPAISHSMLALSLGVVAGGTHRASASGVSSGAKDIDRVCSRYDQQIAHREALLRSAELRERRLFLRARRRALARHAARCGS